MNKIRNVVFAIAVAIVVCGFSTVGKLQMASAQGTPGKCAEKETVCGWTPNGLYTHKCQPTSYSCPCVEIHTKEVNGNCMIPSA